MKLLVDSNLSLSLSSKAADRRPALLLAGVETQADFGFEALASFRNLESVADRNIKSQINTELTSIRNKLSTDIEGSSSLQLFDSARDDLRWFVQRDAAGRLITVLATVGTENRSVVKLIEKIKTACIHFSRNPEQLQEKLVAMAGMFNEAYCDGSSTQASLAGKLMSEKSGAQSVPEVSVVLSDCHKQVPLALKEAEGVQVVQSHQSTASSLRMTRKAALAMALGLLLLWVFYNKFVRVRHRRH
jgi:hypothetical protein